LGEVVRAIRESELEECLDLWTAVWPEAGRAFFARYLFGDHDFQPEYTRVCEVDGRIVSAAHIVKRIVSCGEFTLTVGGIANVATLSEYRRRGLSTACLQQAIQVMEADAIDVSLLFTGTHALYEPLGWERAPSRYTVGELKSRLPVAYSLVTVRPYAERDDAAIHQIYADFNRARPGTVRRSEPYWRDWVGLWRGQSPGRAIVAESEDAPVGYCIYRVDESDMRSRVEEFGVRRGAEEALEPLFRDAAADALAHGIRSFSIPLSTNPAVWKAAEKLCAATEERKSESAMVRFLHRDNLLRGLAPSLTMRWMETGSPAGCLRFVGPYGGVKVGAGGGFLRVEETDDVDGALSQADLFQMLIGRGLPATLQAEDRAFADALFPRQEPWFWELDGF
jgi:GNAT superfamily N-acetyltransferase